MDAWPVIDVAGITAGGDAADALVQASYARVMATPLLGLAAKPIRSACQHRWPKPTPPW